MQRIEPLLETSTQKPQRTLIHKPSYKLSTQIYITRCHEAYRVYLANKKYRKIRRKK